MTAQLTTFVDIDATPERVWQVLTDLTAYERWNPFITRAEGTFAEGSRVLLTLLPVNVLVRPTLRPTVVEVIPCQRLRLRSRMDRLGLPRLLDVEHTITLKPQDGGVRLWQDSYFQGLLVPLTMESLNRHRRDAFTAMNAALKERCEGRHAARPG